MTAVCSGTEPPVSSRYVAYAIQGDLRPARALLELRGAGSGAAERDLAQRFRERFVDRSEPVSPDSGDPLVDAIVASYRRYWSAALMNGRPAVGADERLADALRSLVTAHDPAGGVPGPQDAFEALAPVLQRRGFHVLADRAMPLQDLFIWRNQNSREFDVGLVDRERPVRVVFLSGFSSQGWKHYASLGLATTTGWVDGETLYCVEWAYAPDTENFAVSYLKHETQHLADFEQFPGLSSVELEYRAKLTELAFASATLRRLLEDFSAKAAPNPESPHAAANWRVVRAVYEALYGEEYPGDATGWATVNAAKVNRQARRLLVEDTARLMEEY